MNFRQLETFYWISKLGTFVAAAERLHATQSTISVRIAELEQSLGVKLFERQGRSVRLTTVGRTLLPFAEQSVTLAANIQQTVGRNQTLAGMIRIGVGEIVAVSWLPLMIQRLKESYSCIEFELTIDVTVNLYKMLDAGKLDVAIGVGPHTLPTMLSDSLGRTRMHWAGSPQLGLGGRTLSAAEIARLPIYSLSKDSHLHVTLLKWFGENSAVPPIIHTCNSLSTMIALTRHGTGIAVLPRTLIENELRSGELEILQTPDAVGHYEFFIVREGAPVNPIVDAIVQIALEVSSFDRAC